MAIHQIRNSESSESKEQAHKGWTRRWEEVDVLRMVDGDGCLKGEGVFPLSLEMSVLALVSPSSGLIGAPFRNHHRSQESDSPMVEDLYQTVFTHSLTTVSGSVSTCERKTKWVMCLVVHVRCLDEVNEYLCAGHNLLLSMHKCEWDAR